MTRTPNIDTGKSQQMKEYAEIHGIPVIEVKPSNIRLSFTKSIIEWKVKND